MVAEIATPGALENLEQAVERARHPEVHIERRPRLLEAELQGDTSFDDESIWNHLEEASEKPVENEELSKASDIAPAPVRRSTNSGLERLFECLWRLISPNHFSAPFLLVSHDASRARLGDRHA